MTTTTSGPTTSAFDYWFHQVALVAVTTGVVIALLAALFSFVVHGRFAAPMLQAALFAVGAAAPVYVNYRRMRRTRRLNLQKPDEA